MLLLTVGLLQNSYAQYAGIEDLKFENYTPPNGLPSDFIETITQDKYGFIWLGTHNGLLRFDGVQFKTYLHDGTDSNSLPDNDARFVLGDSSGKIWITSRKGFSREMRRKPPVPHFLRLSCTLPSHGFRKSPQGSHAERGITDTS